LRVSWACNIHGGSQWYMRASYDGIGFGPWPYAFTTANQSMATQSVARFTGKTGFTMRLQGYQNGGGFTIIDDVTYEARLFEVT
ncbi:MAG TPA: hypothetical protein VM537_37215, partial [Anaerolineae bacterium]|nr:hypothetical protein [Anaerolineae bacterium]